MGESVGVGDQPGKPVQYYSQGLRERFRLDGLRAAEKAQQGGNYADITYELDEEKFRQRTQRILSAGKLPTTVPPGFPDELRGPLVWSSNDFPNEDEFIVRLDIDDVKEIVTALSHFNDLGKEGEDVDKASFPLPTLGPRLEKASDEVYNGKGFTIIRGLDPDQFSLEDYTVVYLGVSSYIAERRGKQDQRGSMLLHVMATDGDSPSKKDKPFHNDTVTDTLALITRQCSAEGGRSILSSAWSVYNELAATRPDILHTMSEPDWPFDTYGREPPYYKRSILYYYHGNAIMSFSRRSLVGHPKEPRSKGIPGLSERQAEALDAVHYLAEKHSIAPSMEKGDMRFINNMAILHRREAFVNQDDRHRHLIRLWLNNPEKNWDLPKPLKLAWARVFDDEERGKSWDLSPRFTGGRFKSLAIGSCD